MLIPACVHPARINRHIPLLPRTVSVPIAQPANTKATTVVHRAPHGPPVRPDGTNPIPPRLRSIACAPCGRPVVLERIKQQRLPPPPTVGAAIARTESTKPTVPLRAPVVPFVRPGMLFIPRPPVARLALAPRTKHNTTRAPSPVRRIPPAPPVAMEVHPPLPSIERAPIVNRLNFKHPVLLLAHRAPRGPPAELDKKVPRLPPPPTVPAPIAPHRSTKHKIHSRGLHVLLGPPVPLVKKEQYLV